MSCAPGGYCPGSIQVSFDGIGGNNTCPIEYNNSAAGSTSIDDCYLETTPGAWVYMQGHGLDNCTNTSYCPGGVKVYYSGTSVDGRHVTGGATSCTSLGAFYTRSDGNYASASTCYGTTSAGHYLANAEDATESTCAAGGYCQGSVTVHYGSTGGRTICDAGMYSGNGASSCSNVSAGQP